MRRCSHCARQFTPPPRYPGARLCLDCYRKREDALRDYDSLLSENARLRAEIRAGARQGEGAVAACPEKHVLAFLLRVAHPDHNPEDPDRANTALRWLIKLKNGA